jgi:hypothetical protein
MTLDQHEWVYRKLEGSLKEYARGISQKTTLEWIVGEVKFATEKAGLSSEEVKGILGKVELYASDAERKGRLVRLREHPRL